MLAGCKELFRDKYVCRGFRPNKLVDRSAIGVTRQNFIGVDVKGQVLIRVGVIRNNSSCTTPPELHVVSQAQLAKDLGSGFEIYY